MKAVPLDLAQLLATASGLRWVVRHGSSPFGSVTAIIG